MSKLFIRLTQGISMENQYQQLVSNESLNRNILPLFPGLPRKLKAKWQCAQPPCRKDFNELIQRLSQTFEIAVRWFNHKPTHNFVIFALQWWYASMCLSRAQFLVYSWLEICWWQNCNELTQSTHSEFWYEVIQGMFCYFDWNHLKSIYRISQTNQILQEWRSH